MPVLGCFGVELLATLFEDIVADGDVVGWLVFGVDLLSVPVEDDLFSRFAKENFVRRASFGVWAGRKDYWWMLEEKQFSRRHMRARANFLFWTSR